LQAVVLYEEEMCNSKSQLVGLHLLVGTLCESNQRSPEANAACIRAANTLLKLADQCRAGLATAHLSAKANEPQGVLKALTRGVSTATKIIDRLIQAQLLVELLNHYLYFYEKGNTLVLFFFFLSIYYLVLYRAH
jgi:vacuolar protein sorting-associated protein 35